MTEPAKIYEPGSQHNHYERDNFERDIDFYTALQFQVRRQDRPAILEPAREEFEKYMVERYDLSVETLTDMSKKSNYAEELSKLEKLAKGEN